MEGTGVVETRGAVLIQVIPGESWEYQGGNHEGDAGVFIRREIWSLVKGLFASRVLVIVNSTMTVIQRV